MCSHAIPRVIKDALYMAYMAYIVDVYKCTIHSNAQTGLRADALLSLDRPGPIDFPIIFDFGIALIWSIRMI